MKRDDRVHSSVVILASVVTLALAMCLGTAVQSAEPADSRITPAQRSTMMCIEAMGQTTRWGECVNLMFKACAGHEIGGTRHLSCLTAEHDGWRESMDAERLALLDQLSVSGANELAQVMGHWFGYVAQKCAQVALGKPKAAAEAAQTGCEISEIAGLTTELVACREGRSTAPYCVIRN
ncbi:MAG: hypothetical protein AAF458_13710 [Pseudomonadota bacterium]